MNKSFNILFGAVALAAILLCQLMMTKPSKSSIVYVVTNDSAIVEVPQCGHDGKLTSIVVTNTWRVVISSWTKGQKTEIGVCKQCGAITDSVVSAPGVFSHWPIAGSPLFDIAADPPTMEELKPGDKKPTGSTPYKANTEL